MVYRETDIEMTETDRLTPTHLPVSRGNDSTRSLEPLRINSAFIDDRSSTISSPEMRPESYRAPSLAPLLPVYTEEGTSPVVEPPPSFSPPAYRSVAALPPYSAWKK